MSLPMGVDLRQAAEDYIALNGKLKEEASAMAAKLRPFLARKRQILRIKEEAERRAAVKQFMAELNPILDEYNDFVKRLRKGPKGKRADVEAKTMQQAFNQLITGLEAKEIRELARRLTESTKRLGGPVLTLSTIMMELKS